MLRLESVPFSPHDFLRNEFAAADRALFVDSLIRPLAPEHDLRLQVGEIGVFAECLPWDTQFFGYKVARLNGIFPLTMPFNVQADYHQAVEELLEAAGERGVRYLFASVFMEDLPTIRALAESGFALIETRATYHRSLPDYSYPERYATRPAVIEDIPFLAETARSMINPYDRFHADPFIAPADADRLMAKWVEASIKDGFADLTLVPNVAEPGAFATVKFHRDQWDQWGVKLAQSVVLGAVSPAFKGWYIKLISEINYYLKDVIGAEHCFFTTQLTNYAAIRSIEKLGYTYGRGSHIFRKIL